MDKVTDVKLKDFINLIQLNYLRNDGNVFIPEKENIMPYFEGHNSPTFLSLFWQPDVLIDTKTNTTIDTKLLIGAITSRPLTVTIYDSKQKQTQIKYDVFYVDYLCVKKGFRKKNIAPQLIQTHEYNQCHMNQNICVSLFKREGELTGIVPLMAYKTYIFDMKNWIKPPNKLHSKTTLLVGDSQNMYYLSNFIAENKKWDITIIPEISNLLSLVSSKNLYIYMLLTEMEIAAIYVFKKTCTNIEKGKELLSLIGTMNSKSNPTNIFIQGFKNALWAILLDNPGYHYLSIEDISDNNCIINNIKTKTHPICESPTAYFLYNYARSPFNPYKSFIIN